MKNTKVKTWLQLKQMIDSFPEEILKEKIPTFVFVNGEMEMLNGINFVGNSKKTDSHCSDITEGFYKRGTPYLLCGLHPYL